MRHDRTRSADARLAWIVGGTLLLGQVVVEAVLMSVPMGIPRAYLLGTAMFSAALLVFAFGIRGSGSVTARRPLGTAALAVLALWTFGFAALGDVVYNDDLPLETLRMYGYADTLVQAIAALVAVVAIGRAGAVPTPWNWAPAWVLAATAGAWVLSQQLVLGDTVGTGPIAAVTIALQGLVHVGGTILLGVLALLLAERARRPRTVTVYPRPEL